MIVGLGLDLFDVTRLEGELKRRGPAAELRLFSPRELASCTTHRHPAQALASRFAAKEALFKALALEAGEGWRWCDVEVTANRRSCPSVRLRGRLADLANARGVARILLSLATTKRHAVASVVLETRP